MKTCKTCREEKAVSEFGKHSKSKDRKHYSCKKCVCLLAKRYRIRNPETRRKHYVNNKERVLVQTSAYRAAHKAEERAARRAHYLRNRDRVLRASRDYRRENLAVYAQATSKRRAAKLQATPSWADIEIVGAFYRLAAWLTEATGVPHEVDHVVPLQGKTVCGLHWEGNLEVISRAANRAKSRFLWPDMAMTLLDANQAPAVS